MKKISGNIHLALITLALITTARSECGTKMGLKGSTCVKCADTNCLECKSNYAVCKKCPEKFGLKDNKCVNCSSHCIKCVDINKCDQCEIGSVKKGDICQQCGSYCKKCSGVNQCDECKEKHYLINGKCVHTCPEGFTVHGKDCSRCPLNCLDCVNPDVCDNCATGLYKHTEGNSVHCKKCMLGCAVCSGETTCTRCETGYTLTDNRYCEGYNGSKYWWVWMVAGLFIVSLLVCCLCRLIFRKQKPEYREMQEVVYQRQPEPVYEPVYESAVLQEPERDVREEFFQSEQPRYREVEPIKASGPLEIRQYEGAPPTTVQIGPPVRVTFTPPRNNGANLSNVSGLQFYDDYGNPSRF